MALPPPGTWFFFRKKNCKLVIKNNMHKFTPSLFLLMSVFSLSAGTPEKFSGEKSDPAIPAIFPQEDPSEKEVYLFSYFTGKNNNRNGLHFAWSEDGYRWTAIGPEHSFLKSDYGSWSTEKKMRDPFIMQGPDGVMHCLWTINWDADVIGHASTRDFIHWSRQSYIKVMKGYEARNIWAPEMIWDEEKGQFVIFWASTIKVNGEWKTEPGYKYDHRMYCTTTKDFRTFSPARLFFDPGHNVIDATIRKAGGRYIMIYKDERELPVPQKNLLVAVSDHAEGPYERISEKPITRNWVEGPAICHLPDSSYLVYFEAYRDHFYEALRTRDFVTFEDATSLISMPSGAKHGSIARVPRKMADALIKEAERAAVRERENSGREGVPAPKPVYRDPVYDGAADPMVVWNPHADKWWMFYTNRRANVEGLPGVSWVFGTPVGIAESADGANWSYAGTAEFPDLPVSCGGDSATFWAPDVVKGDDGKWHMYLSIQPGIDVKWGLPGFIAHLTSNDLRTWKYESRLENLGVRVIDADILRMADGTWRMYYKGQNGYSHIGMTESRDLYNWSDPVEVMRISGEGPAVFLWKGNYWMLLDTWKGQQVFRSQDGKAWERQPGDPLLGYGTGTGTDDVPNALHANVVISNDRLYLYYFTHPGRIGEDRAKDGYEQRRTSIQVVELELNSEGWITADRNRPTYVLLFPEEPVRAALAIDARHSRPISEELFGIFFEDINYAADGGLYAELVQNRSFEYSPEDLAGRDSAWNPKHSWRMITEEEPGPSAGGPPPSGEAESSFVVADDHPLHANNPRYALLTNSRKGRMTGLSNGGFDGIVLKKGERYDFSLFARVISGKPGKIAVRLSGDNGEVLAEAKTGKTTGQWKKHTVELISSGDAAYARLEILFAGKGALAVDMVSLFPRKTFRNRPNGLRADLAETIAALKPRFVRFPGGCLVHGDGLGNMYRWKNTVGPVEQRKGQRNIWNYHQTGGLGFFEFFQFCEDIGAEPLPVLPAAVSCQNSRDGGQQALPMEEMDDYVLEVLDLAEFANGAATTPWGRVRAVAGHPEPFGLKYLGIGNEELISDAFEERFELIYNALREKHPEITVIGTVGPFSGGTDYEEGWKIADRLVIPVVDEHYYQSPGWFIHNQDFYDGYRRDKSKVYLGEYASWGNTLYNALAEAAYMTSLERNGDVVVLASYAPMLAKEGHTQWNPDLIYFNNTEVKPTVNYHVQQLFSLNAGHAWVQNTLAVESRQESVARRIACSVVTDRKGDLVVKLVNLLPVTVSMQVKTEGMSDLLPSGEKTVLAGMPGDRDLRPETTEINAAPFFSVELPAWSFTLIRLKKQ